MSRFLELVNTKAIIILIAIALAGGEADDSNPAHSEPSEIPQMRTYILLYKNVQNSPDNISCSLPVNVTFSGTDAKFQHYWEAPSGVNLETRTAEIVSSATSRNTDDQLSRAWVELTGDGTLVFHNPDTSVSGPYICRGKANNQIVYETTVWVHVLHKTVFDVQERIRVGFVVTAVFLGVIMICVGVYMCPARKKARYHLANTSDQFDNLDMKLAPV